MNSCSTSSSTRVAVASDSGVAGEASIGIIPGRGDHGFIVKPALEAIKGSGMAVRVKICGVRRHEDVDEAVAAGADAIGFNFYPASPRYVAPVLARELLARLPPFVEPVGVFVRQTLAEVGNRLDEIGRLRVVQIHGGPPEVASSPLAHVPAFQVRERADLDVIVAYLQACREAGAVPSRRTNRR